MAARSSKLTVKPVARYMLLCDDLKPDTKNDRRVTIVGLISNFRAGGRPRYPFTYHEMCVFLALTECRGHGEGQIICVNEETGLKVFETPRRAIRFRDDPLDIVGIPFRIRECRFPSPGMYLVQFWFDGVKLEERPLRMR
jgi:hypothetical protein